MKYRCQRTVIVSNLNSLRNVYGECGKIALYKIQFTASDNWQEKSWYVCKEHSYENFGGEYEVEPIDPRLLVML